MKVKVKVKVKTDSGYKKRKAVRIAIVNKNHKEKPMFEIEIGQTKMYGAEGRSAAGKPAPIIGAVTYDVQPTGVISLSPVPPNGTDFEVTGLATGEATVTAIGHNSNGDEIRGTAQFQVPAEVATSIEIVPRS